MSSSPPSPSKRKEDESEHKTRPEWWEKALTVTDSKVDADGPHSSYTLALATQAGTVEIFYGFGLGVQFEGRSIVASDWMVEGWGPTGLTIAFDGKTLCSWSSWNGKKAELGDDQTVRDFRAFLRRVLDKTDAESLHELMATAYEMRLPKRALEGDGWAGKGKQIEFFALLKEAKLDM